MEKIESQQYRDNLAEEIKSEPDKEKRKEILAEAKETEEYYDARKIHQEENMVDIKQECVRGVGFDITGVLSLEEKEMAKKKLKSASKVINSQLKDIFPETFNISHQTQLLGQDSLRKENSPYAFKFTAEMESELLLTFEQIKERVKKLPHNQFQVLPGDISSPEDVDNEYIRKLLEGFYTGNKRQGVSLYEICSFLQNKVLDEKVSLNDVSEILKEKKVLVLGDDTGSLSEVLNKLGANAYGVEIDTDKVKIAHSGLLSEELEPQNQVIQGNLWDIQNINSALYKTLQQYGPFDVIYSSAVINGGSGFPEEAKEHGGEVAWAKFITGLDALAEKDGIIIHSNAEDVITHYSTVPEYRHHRVEKILHILYQMKEGEIEVNDEEKEQAEKLFSYIRDSYWQREDLWVTRPGFLEKIQNIKNKSFLAEYISKIDER